jgi:SAM-dependent methyltransferase
MRHTEFYESAVKMGFYGLDVGGLTGKKDNVRKYWEDISIKLLVRPFIEDLLQKHGRLRIVDLGSGSGEGFELLTHIPIGKPLESGSRSFALEPYEIETYIGLDISAAMILQGRKNYSSYPNVRFQQCDLTEGFPAMDEPPFDLYFSSYSSLSHLRPPELQVLLEGVCNHAESGAYIIFDLLGKFSPEWPKYWNATDEMLPYTMAYLLSRPERTEDNIEWFDMCYWCASSFRQSVDAMPQQHNRKRIRIKVISDRSILVGRHMDTGLFNADPTPLRHQVNRLFERDYRGDIESLICHLKWLKEYRESHPIVYERISRYHQKWNTVIRTLSALMNKESKVVKEQIESTEPALAEELELLAWLYHNADRFPVVDFWASVMGPQVACVLRNIEMSFLPGLGCGHGLFCIAEIADSGHES